MRIAIIGSGIAGLGAAWALHRDHEIELFEAETRIGGHSNTVDVATARGTVPVDTGFIVYNETTYPHLTKLFAALDVPTQPSDMSFSFSLDGHLEYAGSFRGLLADPRNVLRGRYRAMVRDILRFRSIGEDLLATAGERTLHEHLTAAGFSEGFMEDYLLPMAAAIWSARRSEIRQYPAATMLRFLSNHGLIRISDRPAWRTVTGGSRSYVERITEPFADRIRLDSPVAAVRRGIGSVEVATRSGVSSYDHVVLAVHSDQALRILGEDARPEEAAVLGAIRYEANLAVLHSDPSLMPQRKSAWSSWNYVTTPGEEGRTASVTYWMNRLQDLDPATPLFVSLNPSRRPRPDLVWRSFHYAHPQFDGVAIAAQQKIPEIQGIDRTWFAGAWCGYGFHEDGLQSGLHVAAALGSPVPWYRDVTPMSSAPEPRLGAMT